MSDLDPASLTTDFWTDVVVTDTTASTNADLAEAARAGAPEGTVHTTRHQTAGRGRLDRTFDIPEGTGIAVSVLLRPSRPFDQWPWIPLLTGLAVLDTVTDLDVPASLKWPNDVLVDDRKLAGILVEAADQTSVVVGIGLNVTLAEDELPVPNATSLLLEDASSIDRADVLRRLLAHLEARYTAWNAGADLREEYAEKCSTVDSFVTVSLPDGTTIDGHVSEIDASGRIVVDGTPVSAGDVTHVRTAEDQTEAIQAFWADARVHARLGTLPGYFGPGALESLQPPAWSFSEDPAEADRAVDALVETSEAELDTSLAELEAIGVPVPELGTLGIVLDGSGRPRALVATSDVEIIDTTDGPVVRERFRALHTVATLNP